MILDDELGKHRMTLRDGRKIEIPDEIDRSDFRLIFIGVHDLQIKFMRAVRRIGAVGEFAVPVNCDIPLIGELLRVAETERGGGVSPANFLI